MKKINRILKNEEFSKILKNGKKFHTKYLSFYFLKNLDHSFKIGICVSKKVSKLAIVRNKLKRQINASLIKNHFNLNYDLVIITKKEILNISFNEIDKEILNFIKNLQKQERKASNEG